MNEVVGNEKVFSSSIRFCISDIHAEACSSDYGIVEQKDLVFDVVVFGATLSHWLYY